ncbi:hypothetical protein [Polluticoccus soli]|uniref:hypothetical protein n=1 Tax=Polluticoccus soli TaxID=3034150 RepID=UPI0023E0E17A|nr:hypothetical protein [Flavipsychrobacter sp. JY13-12]
MEKRTFWDNLGDQSQLSMLGKGLIGIVGGTLVMIVTCFRKCDDRKPIGVLNASEIEVAFIKPALGADSIDRNSYYTKMGVPARNVDSVINYINNRSKGGTVIRTVQEEELKYLNDSKNYLWPNPNSKETSYYYVVSVDSPDFILGVRDTFLDAIINVPN